MSEYQYVAFRAIDRPLTDKELKYAQSQSSRAEITRWSFTNEYHYGDFRGDPEKLLQRGYDVHLHYANFGVRTVMMRLPAGIPFPRTLWSKYVDGERVKWKKDKKRPAGVLIISPYFEPGDLEEIWEPDAYVDDVVAVRNDLVGGDLRTLYAAWLCGAQDSYADPEEVIEPAVPAGIGRATHSCQRLLELFDVDPLTLVAAGETAMPCPEAPNSQDATKRWVERLPADEVRELLIKLLVGDSAKAKAETIARIREESKSPTWVASSGSRTLKKLDQRAMQLRDKESAREKARHAVTAKREAKRKERERQERMKKMVQDPKKWLKESDKLVAERSTANYKMAAEILADLGEAIGGDDGEQLVRKHAAHLARSYPTLTHLKSSLRKRGLLS